MDDLFSRIISVVYADPLIKESAEKKLKEEHVPNYLGILEKLINVNDSAEGWSYGSQVTYADMTIAVIVGEYVFSKEPSVAEKFPNVKKCIDAVHNLPNIAEWIKKRPDSKF